MSVYILAITKITDAEKYNSEFMPAIKKAHKAHDVKVVAMSNAPQMLMGEPRGNRVVLLQVQDEAHARAFLEQPRGKSRHGHCSTLYVRGPHRNHPWCNGVGGSA
jgi:uncharacterized protein (DUF1330 family)